MFTSSLELARRIERGEAVNIATRIDAMRAADPKSLRRAWRLRAVRRASAPTDRR
jgi:hypothetical protein